jgi:iron(III) transport system substrate-binding protein
MKKLTLFAMLPALCLPSLSLAQQKEIVVYSARIKDLIDPVFKEFTAETGIAVKYHTDSAESLLVKLKAEGKDTPADVLITVDAGNLWQANELGLFKPTPSPILAKNIPSHLRDPNDMWFGFSVRARTLAYNTQKVKPEELSTYEALADKKWHQKLCLRTSKKVYNQSLVATMIAEHGEEKTSQVVRGWVYNLAAPVFSNDTSILQAIASGQCDVGIVNSYYYGRLIKEKPELPVKLFWPNQQNSGVHVNVSGGGVLKYSKNPVEATKLLEWLSGDKAQALFANLNLEFPANPKVAPDPLTASWGTFKSNHINVSKAGALQTQAIRLMDREKYH